MCEAGRIRHHLKHNLWRPESTILFVGYQAAGSVGRKLVDGEPVVKLFGEEIQVHANIRQMEGISGHADRDMLLNWLGAMNTAPKCVFVNHGDTEVCDRFVSIVEGKLGFQAIAPYSGDGYDLITGACFQKGVVVPAQKNTSHKRAEAVYERLLVAVKRLMTQAGNMKGATNKEIIKLTDQINSLCDKFKR